MRLTSARLYLRRRPPEATIITTPVRTAVRAAAVAAAVTAASPAVIHAAPPVAPGGTVRAAVPQVSPGPPDGTFAAGPAAWSVLGPVAPAAAAGGGLVLAGNTSVMSAPVAVPADAQALRVTVAAPGRGALLQVRARPVEGGSDIVLGTLAPPVAPTRMAVAAAPIAGRTVRLVVDPVPAFGSSLTVTRVGPFIRPLPGWRVRAGAPDVARRPGGAALLTGDVPLRAASPAFRPGPGAVALVVAVRGAGVVRADAGGRAVQRRAGRNWRDLRVPLPARARRAVLSLTVTPGVDGVELRDIGVVRRSVRLVGLRAMGAGRRAVITGATRPAAPRAVFTVRTAAGRVVGRGRTDARGRLRVTVPAGRGELRVVLADRRDLVGTRAVVRGPRQAPAAGVSPR